jgi:hypothetical protein
MNDRPIIDAGPALNFFSVNKERLLISVLGRLSTPETVAVEVIRKARTDERFRSAETVWNRLTPDWLEVLSDDVTPELAVVVNRISGIPMIQRKKQAKDLGETMVVAHAVVAAQNGAEVVVLIDEANGARIATAEKRRLERLQAQGIKVGSITLVNTLTVLERAAGGTHLLDRAAMRALYQRLRNLDDGLVPIGETDLMSPALWRAGSPGGMG